MITNKALQTRDDIESDMCQEKKKEEHLTVLKIVWMHQYKDSSNK